MAPRMTEAIEPRQESEVATVTEQIEAVEAKAAALVVADQGGLAASADLMREIAGIEKSVEAKRVELVKPHNDIVNRINEIWKPFTTRIGAADANVRIKQSRYEEKRQAEERERIRVAEEARRKAEEEERERSRQAQALAEAGVPSEKIVELVDTAPVFQDVPEAARPMVRSESGAGVTFVTEGLFEVVDSGLVPREWLCVDESKIRRAVRPEAGVRDIPGVRIWTERKPRRI